MTLFEGDPDLSVRVETDSATNSSRIDTHYRWIIMLAILVVAVALIIVGAVWLRRRYAAKHRGLYHAANSGGSSGTLFKHPHGSSVQAVNSVPGSAASSAPHTFAPPAVPPVSQARNSRYADAEPMPSSSRTAVVTPGHS